jgi:Gpi16 subunit, GPI transamidase component
MKVRKTKMLEMHMVVLKTQTMQRPPLSRSEQLTFSVLSDGENAHRPKIQVRLESEFLGPLSFMMHGNAMRDIFVSSLPFPVTHVHVQAANQASQFYPSLTSSSSAPSEITGPSGILIQVEYDTSDTAGENCAAFAASSSALLRQYFLNSTLPQLVGSRRVLTAPLGSSMSIRRLHRMVQCSSPENTVAIVQCTALLPFEGAHAAFSVEGFRTFLPSTLRMAGIGSMATPAEWSQWFIGSGQAIPETVSEAANYWSQSTESLYSSSFSRLLVGRRMYWIDWRRQMVPVEEHHSTPILTTRYGLQYTVQLPRSSDISRVHQRALSLNDLLPSSDQFWHPDPFADTSTIQVIPSSSIEWGSACEAASLNPKREGMRKQFTRNTTLDRTQPCFNLLWREENLTKPEITVANNYFWSVYAHVGRPYAGQAYRGTLIGQVQNRLPYCGTSVRLQQWIPGVVEPIWQSLRIRVISLPESSSMKEARSISVQEANYQVEFQENGSFLWHLRYSLPPQSQLEWRLDYGPSFLSIDEFPGDANRGFEIPPVQADFRVWLDGSDDCHAILKQTLGTENAPFMVRLYSNAVLLLAPLPDRSMPFNVLSFTCTFYVFVIGSLMNLMVKKVSAQMKAALQGKKESKLRQLWKKVKSKFDRFTLRKQQLQNEAGNEKKGE